MQYIASQVGGIRRLLNDFVEPGLNRAQAASSEEVHLGWAQRVATFYDQRAGAYAAEYHAQSGGGELLRERRQLVLSLLGPAPRPDRRLLDVGCGSGELFPVLTPAGYRFYGVDLSHGMLDEARRRNPELDGKSLAQTAAEHLPFPDACFDCVVSTGVVEYTMDPVQTLAEFARVLTPGGVLVVSLPHHWSPYALLRGYVYLRLATVLRPWYRRLTGRINPRPPADPHGQRRRYKYSARWQMRHVPPGMLVEDLVFGGFKLLPSPLDSLFPRLDIHLIRALGGQGRGPLRGLGTYLLARLRKRPADSTQGTDLHPAN